MLPSWIAESSSPHKPPANPKAFAWHPTTNIILDGYDRVSHEDHRHAIVSKVCICILHIVMDIGRIRIHVNFKVTGVVHFRWDSLAISSEVPVFSDL